MTVKPLVVAIACTVLACGSSPLHPIDTPPPPTVVVPPFGSPPELPPNDPPPQTPPDPPPTTPPVTPPDQPPQPFCATAAAHSACTDDAGRAGECVNGSCVAWDMQSYGAPPAPSPTWCPLDGGPGTPAIQRLNPVPGVACNVIGGGEQAYGACPDDPSYIRSFADTDLSTLTQRTYDLRWLKFAGVDSLRFVLPTEPSHLTFMITDFAWGAGLVGYKISISDTPCAVNQVDTEFDMHHCEAPGHAIDADIGYTDRFPSPCTDLLAGHAYYLNIYGDGPADPGEDGVIDAGERLLIDITFDRK